MKEGRNGSRKVGGLIVQLSALALSLCLRGTRAWERFLNLFVPFNQSWAKDPLALVFFVSNTTMVSPRSGKELPSPTHSFDARTASGHFALQASLMGWYVHGLMGYDADRALEGLRVPKGYKIEAVYAVGRKVGPAGLPEELRDREAPSDRRSLRELAFEGGFPQIVEVGFDAALSEPACIKPPRRAEWSLLHRSCENKAVTRSAASGA